MNQINPSVIVILMAVTAVLPSVPAFAAEGDEAPAAPRLTGAAAFGDWTADAPGLRRLITPADLPAPYETRSASNGPRLAPKPENASLKTPPGFSAALLAQGLHAPRVLRTAPNGDIFVSETRAGRIRVIRLAGDGASPQQIADFALGLDQPYGIAFYPPGPNPEWVYVANTGSVMRFPYRSGDLKARGPAETIVERLPEGGHSTRDVVFSNDGKRMFVSVGSESNVATDMGDLPSEEIRQREARATGAAWGSEERRANVLVFTPEGRDERIFATGIRNCVGMAEQPVTGDLWCSVNERDGLGDNLVPDYVTRVREGAFYGWPWFYLGGVEDPRHKGKRPDLKDKTTVPDVLLQAHSASLQMTFYTGSQFPEAYRGDAFAAEHGSWNRSRRTGYKVIRIILKDGAPTGEYEDFVTGFVVNGESVWGRPAGIAMAADGSLLMSDDARGAIWRITYTGPAK